jgi:hypothetical protein
MNLAEWVREVRRLTRVLHPDVGERERSYVHTAEIRITHRPERPNDARPSEKSAPPSPEVWIASGPEVTAEAATPEEAAASVIAQLEKKIADKIAVARRELERLEAAAQGVGRLRVVRRSEKPS